MNENFIAVDGIFSDGYGFIPKKLMRDKRLTVESKAIYAYLSSFAGAGMTSYPSVSLMVVELGMSKDRFYKHRKLLLDLGYIQIEQRKGEENKFSKNIYVIKTKLPSPCFKDTGNKDTGNEDTGNKDTNSNNSNSNSLNSNSNKNTSSSNDDRSPYSESFERWWAIYPRKLSKGRAWKIWKQDKLDKRVDELIEKLQQQVAIQYSQTETKYIPHPSTYLSDGRYDDEVEQIKGVSNGITANSNGYQKESTMERARREQRELIEQLDSQSDQGVNQNLGVHDGELR